MSLVLVRHGQTAANRAGLLQGRVDLPLTEHGRAQAAAVAAAVGPVDRVVCSPLGRARETAAMFGSPVTIDERWTELDYGEYDQRPLTEVPAAFWTAWRSDPAFAPPGGESLQAVAARVEAACRDLADEASGADVVVVSHVSPIKAAVAWAMGVDITVSWRLFLDVASVCRIDVSARGPSLRSFNATAHLPPDPAG